MKEKKIKIPRFASEQEEADFWSTRSTTKYWGSAEIVPVEDLRVDPALRARIQNRAREKQLISLRLEKRQVMMTKLIARTKTIPYQTLIRSWVEEGLQREINASSIASSNAITYYPSISEKEFSWSSNYARKLDFSTKNSDMNQSVESANLY
jgi:predicted DNA binding CopG/RHH family protein